MVPYAAILIRGLVLAVFLTACVGKVAGRRAFAVFARSLKDMRILPEVLARPIACTVVLTEAGVCALVLVPVASAAAVGLVVAGGLLVVFAVAIAASLHQGSHAVCRCFGSSSAQFGPRHIVRNTLLALVSGIGALAQFQSPALHPLALVTGFAGLVLGALVAAMDVVVELFTPMDRAARPARGS